MDKEKAIETTTPAIAPEQEVKVLTPTEEDLEAKNLALEAEKARLLEESANYKMAYLKEKSKRGSYDPEDEKEEKHRRLIREELAGSRLAEIVKEQDAIVKKALKENKELRLAYLNKSDTPPASMGIHSEGQGVKDTLVTPEQMSAFKARGWSDKDIEKYKKNLVRYGTR